MARCTRMTAALLLAVLISAICGLGGAQDVTRLLKNRQIVSQEIRCVLKAGPCDIIGKTLQKMIPEVLNNNCARCTPQQQQQASQIVGFMQKNHPADWEKIRRMYKKP